MLAIFKRISGVFCTHSVEDLLRAGLNYCKFAYPFKIEVFIFVPNVLIYYIYDTFVASEIPTTKVHLIWIYTVSKGNAYPGSAGMANWRTIVQGVLVLTTFVTTVLTVPAFVALDCHDNKKVAIRVTGANGLYLKIGGCRHDNIVSGNNVWVEMNCVVTWGDFFTATLTVAEDTFAEGDVLGNFMCTAQEGVVVNIETGITAPTAATDFLITDVLSPEVSMQITESDGVTPVTSASVGDDLCLIIKVDDAFDGFSMQVQTIKVISGGKTIWLTGETDLGCQSADEWGVVEEVTESKLRVCFKAFEVLPPVNLATEQVFRATVHLCFSSDIMDCYTSGCIHPTTPPPTAGRRKRDVGSEEIEVSASIVIKGSGNDNSGSNNNNTGGQIGGDVIGETEQQVAAETCEVCMKKSVLYGLIGFFIPALVLAFGASGCLYCRTRRHKKIEEEMVIVHERTPSTVGSSFRNPSFRK